ncbi:hypothetical protein [Streptomyces sp. NPDC047097]|uniref:hypothetical protein n=1 Tax=Streptomyces sp. NPDC047097 TaxID=3155260 RepID=UPI0033CA659B
MNDAMPTTVELPAAQLTELARYTDDPTGFVAEAVATRLQRRGLPSPPVTPATGRLSVPLPAPLLTACAAQPVPDHLSEWVAEAVETRLRHERLREDFRRYQEEHGAFTEEELAAVRAELELAFRHQEERQRPHE